MQRGDTYQETGKYVGVTENGIVWVCWQSYEGAFEKMCEIFDAQHTDFSEYRRVSATQQRKIFGYAIFGKKQFYFDVKKNQWHTMKKVAFGLDYATGDVTHAKALELGKAKKLVQVG